MSARALRIGLTGPIGCGKSTIARWLAEVGGAVIDADRLAREVTEPGDPTLRPIRDRFGDDVFEADGSLDREALAALVFSDPEALAALESIVHPAVLRRLAMAVQQAEVEQKPFVVVEAIKLVEGGLAAWCDEVWLVTCAPATQRARLRARGLDDQDAERRIFAQGPELAARLGDAVRGSGAETRTIDTDGTLEEVRQRVRAALAEALGRRR